MYREDDTARWHTLLQLLGPAREFVGTIGLDLLVDEAEGYAYLRQRVGADEDEGPVELRRLVTRRQLSYPVSLLLALLRKKLAEFDATSTDPRLILGRSEIAEMFRVFLPETADEVAQTNRIDSHISKVVELGFLRRLGKDEDKFEVRRILKAFVDGQWLQGLAEQLQQYRKHALADQGADEVAVHTS